MHGPIKGRLPWAKRRTCLVPSGIHNSRIWRGNSRWSPLWDQPDSALLQKREETIVQTTAREEID